MTSPFDSGERNGTITTSSRIRVWFLKTFRGYRVLTTRRTPMQSTFGEIYYRNTFVLAKEEPPDEA